MGSGVSVFDFGLRLRLSELCGFILGVSGIGRGIGKVVVAGRCGGRVGGDEAGGWRCRVA